MQKQLLHFILWVGLSYVSLSQSYAQGSPFLIIQGKSLTPSLFQMDQVTLGSVVVFLGVECPCSNSYLPHLKNLAQQYEKKGEIQFIGIHSNANETEEDASRHFTAQNLPFPVLQDPQCSIADLYKAYKTPHAFILNPKLEILFQGGIGDTSLYQDGKTNSHLAKALFALQRKELKKPRSVRTLGCIIQRISK